jgi:P27 family predicted phage terminase small subunit
MPPRPIPKKLRILRGRHLERVNHAEPEPPTTQLDPPGWIGTGEAHAKWQELVPLLMGIGVFTDADRDALARYCVLHERWLAAVDACRRGLEVMHHRDKEGRIYNSQISPYATLVHKLHGQLLRIAAEFGLTPASRTSIKGNAAIEHADPLSAWLTRNPVENRA